MPINQSPVRFPIFPNKISRMEGKASVAADTFLHTAQGDRERERTKIKSQEVGQKDSSQSKHMSIKIVIER